MIINYEVNENGKSKTPCPNGKRPLIFNGSEFESQMKVNGVVCKGCRYYEGQPETNAINCSYPDSIQIQRVYYSTGFDIPQGVDKRKLIKKESQQNLKKRPRYAYIEIDGKRIYLGK